MSYLNMDCGDNPSCDGFSPSTTSTSQSGPNFVCPQKKKEKDETKEEDSFVCSKELSTSTTSSTSLVSPASPFDRSECMRPKATGRDAPNIRYELAIAKAVMKEYSTLSGDNLFDHLSDIIRRVLDERPPNVIDFFEEFSRNVREQKFHLPERFPPDGVYVEHRLCRVAKSFMGSLKLPYIGEEPDLGDEDGVGEDSKSEAMMEMLKIEIPTDMRQFITFNERVQNLQFYWNQCGFHVGADDIFQLAMAMDRLQCHPSIMQCRFWGIMYGLNASYYVVEASLTREEITRRVEQMAKEIQERYSVPIPQNTDSSNPQCRIPKHIGPELIPGKNGWDHLTDEEIFKIPKVDPVPIVDVVEVFDVPPEPIGFGLNRFTYFVINSLSDDWIELPIVTPRQLKISRDVKMFLTGDLEADVLSYPCFPGKEKHYLRALIARITAGTYIAPRGFYRRMTKKEQRIFDGEGDMEDEEEAEEEEEEEFEDEGEEKENDVYLLKNEHYEPLPLTVINLPAEWVHTRPAILDQGRVVWFDTEKARKEREKELARILRMRLLEEMGEEYEEEDEEEEEEMGEEEGIEEIDRREYGPPILQPCNFDTSDEDTVPWIARFTSKFTNKQERLLIMHSNTWPGACTFTFDKMCESIYVGWGNKYCARNMQFYHLEQLPNEYPHGENDFIETTDPTVEDEEEYRLALLRRQQRRLMLDTEGLGDTDRDMSDDIETDSGAD